MKKTSMLMLFMIISGIAFSQQPLGDTVLVFVYKTKQGSKIGHHIFKKKDMVTCTFANGNRITASIRKISSEFINLKSNDYLFSEIVSIANRPSVPGALLYSFSKMKYKVIPINQIPEFIIDAKKDTAINDIRATEKDIKHDLFIKKIETIKESPSVRKQRKTDKFFAMYGEHHQNKLKIWLPYLLVNEYFISYEMRVNLKNSFEVGAGYLYDYQTFINKSISFRPILSGSFINDDFNHSMSNRRGFILRGSYMHFSYTNLYIGAMTEYKYSFNSNSMVRVYYDTRSERYLNQSEKSHIFCINLLMGKQIIPWNRLSVDFFFAPGIKLRYGNIKIDGKYTYFNDSHRMHYWEGNYPIYETLTKVYADFQFGVKLGFAFGKKYNDYMKKPL